jgi:soluble lytic murein transglycosylase-like protein
MALMSSTRSSYVYAGDALRRRARIKKVVLLALVSGGLVAFGGSRKPTEASAEPSRFSFALPADTKDLQAALDSTKGELDLTSAQLERANKIIYYSSRYRIGADLAQAVFDIALAEGIEPELAFRLVQVESNFQEKAVSSVGAIGLTQLMLPTATYFEPGISRQAAYERKTNLRIGFRYLRTLLEQYHGDVKLALLVYNRGPAAVEAVRQMGFDPTNGYDKKVTKGYVGKGTVD